MPIKINLYICLLSASAYPDASTIEAAPVASPGLNERSCQQGESRHTASHHRGSDEWTCHPAHACNTIHTSWCHDATHSSPCHTCITLMKSLHCAEISFKCIGSIQWVWTILARCGVTSILTGFICNISLYNYKALTRPYVKWHNVFQGNYDIRMRIVHAQFCTYKNIHTSG